MIHDPDGPIDWPETQALIGRGHPYLPQALYLAVSFKDRRDPVAQSERRKWLAGVLDLVTFGRGADADARPDKLFNLAFTAPGLEAFGMGAADLRRMPDVFREGMASARASKALNDSLQNAPSHWDWGNGNGVNSQVERPKAVVDLLLIFYVEAHRRLETFAEEVLAGLPDHEIVASKHGIHSDTGPFGFRDGISQPRIDPAFPGDNPHDLVQPGEILLGYRKQQGLVAETYGVTLGLATYPDFGLNGSFVVCRQFRQDPNALEQVLSGCPVGIGPDRVKAAMIGRWPGGAPMSEYPHEDPGEAGITNAFGYAEHDSLGHRCPIGSHIRRSNLRDTLKEHPLASLTEMKQHRMLRRGRILTDGGGKYGLMFLGLMGHIRRQFEHVQELWNMAPSIGNLTGEQDPILSPEPGRFSIQDPMGPIHIARPKPLTVLEGGGYFFLPSHRDLKRLCLR